VTGGFFTINDFVAWRPEPVVQGKSHKHVAIGLLFSDILSGDGHQREAEQEDGLSD
jgi:hypothetical protein